MMCVCLAYTSEDLHMTTPRRTEDSTCVCLSLTTPTFIFYICPDLRQIWTPDRYGKGKFNDGVDLGSGVPWDPRGQKC